MYEEIWKPVHFNENYEVSSQGRVRNVRSGRILIPQYNKKNGYYTVWVGRGKITYIHHLVADAFLPDNGCPSRIYHIDGNKTNNSMVNLEKREIGYWVHEQ